ncbi:MAG: hypothetical protein LBH19_03995 [Dysgonamonadaceae bacterium]|jgi:hypothetical protein|nr:hypothetical protein [Dysgonamonadaceae bacterium]
MKKAKNNKIPKAKSMDERIKDLLVEGPLAALYFSIGITVLKEKIDEMTDEEISVLFEKLLHPQRVRDNVEYIYNGLNKNGE